MITRSPSDRTSIGYLAALFLLLASCGVAYSMAFLTTQQISLLTLSVLAACAVFQWPWLLLAFVVIVDQYSSGSSLVADLPGIVTVGSSIYGTHKNGIPVILFAAIIASAGAGYKLTTSTRDRLYLPGSLIQSSPFMVALAGIFTFAGVNVLWSVEQSLLSVVTSSLGASASWILVVAGYLIAYEIASRPGGGQKLMVALEATVILKAAAAILSWITTGGGEVDGQVGVVFFGPGTPILGIAFLGAWAAGRARPGPQGLLVLAAAALCVIASFRITFILAAVAAMLLAAGTSPNSGNFGRIRSTLLAVAAFLVVLSPVPAIGNAVARFTSLDVLLGKQSATPTSADLHNQDIEHGLALAIQNPILGIGPYAEQPAQFVNHASPTIYVHNEYLQQWLRFGALGLAICVALIVIAFAIGVRALRRTSISPVSAAASTLVSIAWLPLLSAPFMSTTQRFPMIFGAALALCEIGTRLSRFRQNEDIEDRTVSSCGHLRDERQSR